MPSVDVDWQPYFAWWPVYVDAYDVSEIKDGKMFYLKWGWVERALGIWTDVEDAHQVQHREWKYRLLRKPSVA